MPKLTSRIWSWWLQKYCNHLATRVISSLLQTIQTFLYTQELATDHGSYPITIQMRIKPTCIWRTLLSTHKPWTNTLSTFASYCHCYTERVLHWARGSSGPLQKKSSTWDMWYIAVDWSLLLTPRTQYETWSLRTVLDLKQFWGFETFTNASSWSMQ